MVELPIQCLQENIQVGNGGSPIEHHIVQVIGGQMSLLYALSVGQLLQHLAEELLTVLKVLP